LSTRMSGLADVTEIDMVIPPEDSGFGIQDSGLREGGFP